MIKHLLLALALALLPTPALAGLSCRGDERRGAAVYLFHPVGRVTQSGQLHPRQVLL
ncbi:MAG: hypothetical protein ACFCVD_15775 [Nodosilinea sp.]